MQHVPESLQPYRQAGSVVTFSPGRINLIGEHTDYNDGFVLPAAIDKAAFVVLTPRTDNTIHLVSVDYNATHTTTTEALEKADDLWPSYLLGVVKEFQLKGVHIGGFDAALTGNIPPGAGLSSSAAVECAMAMALNVAYNNNAFSRLELVQMAQRAENDFVGMKCGIMDQFASVFGRKDHLIQLDCRTKEYEYVPFQLEGITVLLLDSNVKHSLASSEYNTRRQECEKGVALIQQQYPEIQSLRDATMDMVDACIREVDEVVYRRCRYVVGEIQRLQEACEDLRKGDLAAFGKKMFETHDGLSKDYEVSCEELDYLADYVRNNPDVLGARMMGGGFGGCTINLVRTTAVEALVKGLEAPYQAAFGKPFKHYVASIEDGTTVL